MIRTALGDIEPDALGRADYHEHLFQVSPLLPGDELDDEDRSGEEARLLRVAGIDAMVDATPIALGRNPEAVARISRLAGIHVVITTGAHRLTHYGADHWLAALSVEDLAERFHSDLINGLPVHDQPEGASPALGPNGNPVRAGMLKAGIGYWEIGTFEQRVLQAISITHVDAGAPVMVHLESGSAAFEVLELLTSLGVAADRVVLAHIDRNPDPGLHRDLATTGVYLGYDGMARHIRGTDSALLDLIEAVATTAGDRIVLGGDVARRTRYVAYGGMPGLAYLPRRFVPRLVDRVGDDLVHTILVESPRRLLAWRDPRLADHSRIT